MIEIAGSADQIRRRSDAGKFLEIVNEMRLVIVPQSSAICDQSTVLAAEMERTACWKRITRLKTFGVSPTWAAKS